MTGLIAFCMYVGGGTQQIYTIKPDGTGLTQLTSDAKNWNWVRWSPDRRYLLAATAVYGGVPEELWILNANGSPVRQLTGLATSFGVVGWNVGFYQGDWSPDGSKVVVLGQGYYNTTTFRTEADLLVVNVDGSGSTPVTLSQRMNLYANNVISWSPDGTKFLYMTMAGAFYLPDGFTHDPRYGQTAATVCNIDGSGPHNILDPNPGSTAYGMAYIPWGWYSDSRNILAAQQENGPTRPTTFARLLKSDGTTTVKVYEEISDTYLSIFAGVGALSSDEIGAAWNDLRAGGIVVFDGKTVTDHGLAGTLSTDGLAVWGDFAPPPPVAVVRARVSPGGLRPRGWRG